MPRQKKPGAPEPKKRSRKGCWPCKRRKVKCGEEHPVCQNCQRVGDTCDYLVRLKWDGRRGPSAIFGPTHFNQPSQLTSEPDGGLPRSPGPASQASSQAPRTDATPSSKASPGLSSPVLPSPVSVSSPSATASPALVLGPSAFQSSVRGDHKPPQPGQAGGSSGSDVAVAGYGFQTVFPAKPAGPAAGDSQSDRPSKRPRLDSLTSEPDLPWVSPASPVSARPPRPISSSLASAPAGNDDANFTPKSEDGQSRSSPSVQPSPSAPTSRRLSVSSLLGSSQEPRNVEQDERSRYPNLSMETGHLRSTTYYGVDRGFKDLDLGENDDFHAISGLSPTMARGELPRSPADEELFLEFGFGTDRGDLGRDSGGYYKKPAIIRIPRRLEPLPSKLQENPMNLLYFHHFLNHTARVLVPHDDPQSNPFRTILPQMAVKNDNLLSLLLAYSASHRARLLQQAEPARRIALWVQDVFPALRLALDHPTKRISNANVATAIMLASLGIVSPTAFGYTIPWQKHLMLARELITARPEGLRVEHHSSQEGQVCSFLWSWFAYLDVLGGLSGGHKEASSRWILDYKVHDPDDDDEIDCIMGFTTRCIYILARIAELAKQCDARRIGPDGRASPGWQPGPHTAALAEELEADVRGSMSQPPRACAHIHRSGDVARWDRAEMTATNEAYHWAALVHLERRVRGKPSAHPDVRRSVAAIVACLDKVRRGGTAEACLLLPMFTAGCDTASEGLRAEILERMKTVERTGMMQVKKARRLMEKVWEAGQPWETLLSTEFIG